MSVLDLVARDPRITQVTLIEPDIYEPHNAVRHLFPPSAVGRMKAELAAEWLLGRRPDLRVEIMPCKLEDADCDAAVRDCAIGVCAADNEPAKFHFDGLMRRH